MNRHDYTVRPAISEGRTSHSYGHTRLTDDFDRRPRVGEVLRDLACVAVILVGVVMGFVMMGWGS